VLPDPRTFAKLLQLAAVAPESRVLDVGCATGYSTAVLSFLAREVVGLEQDPALAAKATENLAATGATNTRIVTGPLSAGLPAQAPFDVILVNGAVALEPKELLSQLADGGRLATVWRAGAAGYAVLYLNHEGALGERRAFDAFLPVLPGFEKPQGFSF
jgi:protein-L-isoaspartate(D-aspartate) O-methyltransferase